MDRLTKSAEPESSDARWRIVSRPDLAWQEFDDEFLVYLGDLGSTHLLNASAGAILLTLLEQPRPLPLSEILARQDFEVDGGEPPAGDDATALLHVLTEFERIGLIQQC
jgi:PqqD family protein of HPr-rel-A system